jgi:hypothetical protein
VKEVLSKCAKEIRELRQAANDHRASAALSTIESNIANAAITERKFGHAVTDLLDLFDIPDVGIIDKYYQTHPRGDGREHWSDVVSRADE